VDLASAGDPLFPNLGNGGYDVDHYDVALTFRDDGSIVGLTTISADAAMDLPSFDLDFTSLSVGAVRVDGADANWTMRDEELVVTPAVPITAGHRFVVEVEYAGTPHRVATTALPFPIGWFDGPSGAEYVVAEPDAAHSWFPSNDHPSDKATFGFSLTVPSGTFAAANGTLVDTVDDIGSVTYRWETRHPMATYLATILVSDHHSLVPDPGSTATSGVDVRNVLPTTLAAAPPADLARTGEMIRFLSEEFGPYPFERYGVGFVDGFGAALENQTLSLFDTELASSPILDLVLVHELAHQWFGDSVTPRWWGDIWLNEGFATYAELLWIEHTRGETAYRDAIRERTRQARAAGYPPPGSPPATDLFNGGVYQRGALTLAALRDEVGDDAFFEILRTYAARFADGNATTADFVGIAEEISGKDLGAFFDMWLHDPSLPG